MVNPSPMLQKQKFYNEVSIVSFFDRFGIHSIVM